MPMIRFATQSPRCRNREAKAMLERAIAVLKADKDRALGLFTSGNRGFINHNLSVFCDGPDEMLTALPIS